MHHLVAFLAILAVAAAAPQGCARPAPDVLLVAPKRLAAPVQSAAGESSHPFVVARDYLRPIAGLSDGDPPSVVAHGIKLLPSAGGSSRLQSLQKWLRAQGSTPPPSSTAQQ
ncbi:uncharacterized protein LOC134541222 [Bacillus rossius redtenbacheri]|uniref:uncharacterized protein LOC134541222 n=1 Tax=Bacillus rossius redtenbacheri TaxID=93214 RepID=UPI002FDD2895